jgi:hypothetical protein
LLTPIRGNERGWLKPYNFAALSRDEKVQHLTGSKNNGVRAGDNRILLFIALGVPEHSPPQAD